MWMTGVPSFGCSHHFSVPLSSVQPSLQSPSLADTCGFATSRTHCVPGVIADAENNPECHPTHLRCSLKYVNPVWLVVLTILKNMKVNGKDYSIYYGKIKKNVWNHQPAVNHVNPQEKNYFGGMWNFAGTGLWQTQKNGKFQFSLPKWTWKYTNHSNPQETKKMFLPKQNSKPWVKSDVVCFFKKIGKPR